MPLFADKYHGADVRAESGSRWQDVGEQQLRTHAREQAAEIRRLESDVCRLKRELKDANEKLVLATTLPMRQRKEAV